MIDIDSILNDALKDHKKISGPLTSVLSGVLKKVIHQEKINNFIQSNKHLVGLEFNDAVLDHFNFTFRLSNKERTHIPDSGRVIIVANHPLGSLDGLALLKLVSEIRSDVKIVTTDILNYIEPLKDLFLSVDNVSRKTHHRKNLKNIIQALHNEHAVIMFPTGEVSRIRPNGVRDGKWKSGFVHLSRATQSPVIPVHIDAKNSSLFYGLSSIYKPLGTLMLANEMFNKQDSEISFRIGKLIPWKSMEETGLSKKEIAKKMRKQVYHLAKNKRTSLFKSVKSLIHPVKPKLIRNELKNSELIGKTQDGKHIYLYDYSSNSSVMREIGRLRELSFRQVKEGTGNSLDIDCYDRYYRHIILWDEIELEIVGSYRIGEARKIIKDKGIKGLYTNSLFDLTNDFFPFLDKSIELGRSFVQPRYQGKRSLDYLWYGIGAYLEKHPEIKYMFGPVSLSDSYPESAKNLIVNFYSNLPKNKNLLATPRNRFKHSAINSLANFHAINNEKEYRDQYKILKQMLSESGVKIPMLYKQYVELCDPGGCEFLGFNIDPDFSDCIDALILVHIDKIKQKKRLRYIDSHTYRTDAMDVA